MLHLLSLYSFRTSKGFSIYLCYTCSLCLPSYVFICIHVTCTCQYIGCICRHVHEFLFATCFTILCVCSLCIHSMCVHIYVHMYVYMHISMHVHMYLWAYHTKVRCLSFLLHGNRRVAILCCCYLSWIN